MMQRGEPISVPIHSNPVECNTPYQMWAKAAYIEGLRSRPIPIVEAANRVNSLLNRRIDAAQDAQKAFTRRETYLVVALISAVLVAAGMVWWLR